MKIKSQDLWNLDDTLARIILPYLKAFKKLNINCYPITNECKSKKDWEKILDKMIFSMEAIINEGKWFYKFFNKKTGKKGVNKYIAHEKRVAEGLGLFGKYFRSLWW